MILEVHDKKLKRIMQNADTLKKEIGLELARMVLRRCNELMSADNFKEYLSYGIGRSHLLEGNLNGFYGIRLNANYRLIIEPLINQINDNTLKECKNINIKGVMDYHDGKYNWLIP